MNKLLNKKLNLILLLFLNVSFITFEVKAAKRYGPLRSFGDIMQVVNPLIAAGVASQEMGIGHFGIIYSQAFVIMHTTKFIAKQNKWSASKRPYILNKKNRYEGMPSGHTSSAWSAASYVRTFSENKILSVPLYITAIITGYSRVECKEHTTLQVLTGAALAEAVTFINSHLNWSNEYRYTDFSFGRDSMSARFEFRF